MNMARGYE